MVDAAGSVRVYAQPRIAQVTTDDAAAQQLRSLMPELDAGSVVEVSARFRAETAKSTQRWLRSTLTADQLAVYFSADRDNGASLSLLESLIPDLDTQLSALSAATAKRFVEDERRRLATEFEDFDVLGDLLAIFPDMPFEATARASGSLRRNILSATNSQRKTNTPGAIWSQERYHSGLIATAQITGSLADDPENDPTVLESAVERFQRAGFLHEAARASHALGVLYANTRDSRTLPAMLAANELYRASGGDLVTSSSRFGEVWYTLGQSYTSDGDLDSAALAYREAIEIFVAAQDQEGACRSIVGRAGVLCQIPDRETDGVSLFAQAYGLAKAHGYKLLHAVCAFNLANYPDRVGEGVDSLELLRESVALFGELREYKAGGNAAMQLGLKLMAADRGGDAALKAFRIAGGSFAVLKDYAHVAVAMSYIADIHRDAGRLERALSTHHEAIDLNLKSGHPGLLALNALDTAKVLQLMGRYRESEDLHIRSLQLFASQLEGDDGDAATLDMIAQVKLALAEMYISTRRLDEAYHAIDDAEKIYQRIDFDTERHVCVMMKANVHMIDADKPGTAGDLAAVLARMEYAYAAAYFAKHHETLHLASTLQSLAVLELSRGNESQRTEAEQHYRDAIRLFTSMGAVTGPPECRLGLSAILWAAGRHSEAFTELETARAAFTRGGRSIEIARCDMIEARLHASGGTDGVRAALDLAIPAVLYIDATRCQFRDPAARAAWTDQFASIRNDLFEWAHKLKDDELIAQLVETTVNSGVFTTRTLRALAQGTAFDVVMLKENVSEPRALDSDISPRSIDDHIRRKMSTASGDDHMPQVSPVARGVRRLIADASLPVAPAPALLLPSGNILLGKHRNEAAARYGTAVEPGDPIPIL